MLPSSFTPGAKAGASKAGGMLRGAAGRQLLRSPYPKPPPRVGHCQKKPSSPPGAMSHSPEAREQGPAVPPRLGTPLRVWCHRVDTRHFHKPLVPVPALHSLPRPEGPDLAALLSQAVLNTNWVYVPLPPPHVPQNLAHCLPPPLSHRCCSFPPHLVTPLLYPTCSGHPQTATALRSQAPADLVRTPPPPHPPSPLGKGKGENK